MTSKRYLAGRIEELEGGKEYPEASLAQLLSADRLEPVDEERNLVQVDGRLMEDTVTPVLRNQIND